MCCIAISICFTCLHTLLTTHHPQFEALRSKQMLFIFKQDREEAQAQLSVSHVQAYLSLVSEIAVIDKFH
jgi:hypothetical protein